MSSKSKKLRAFASSHETKKEDAKPALVPKLRFPEFREAGGWTTEALGSVAKISTAKVGDKTCIPMSITSGIGLVSQMEKFGRVIAGNSYTNYLQLKKNDFAYNKSATKEYPEGYIALYSGNELAAVPNSIFTCFRIKGDSPEPLYLSYLFLGNLHGRWLRKSIEVGARAHGSLSINQNDLLALPVPFPDGKSALREQQKIAECLSSVEELIAAQARKLDALKTHKKGLMQQLFPREGETQPRLRFHEFKKTGEWTRRKISDILAKTSSPIDVEADKIYREIGVRSHGRGVFHKNPIKGATLGAKRVFRVVKGALVLNIVFAWEQAVATTTESEVGMIASHRFPMYKPKSESCDVEFVKLIFLTPQGKHLLGLASPGGAGRNRTLGKDEFEKLEIILPGTDEQTKIANCLSTLDDLVSAQTQKLEALKTQKTGLMQQLFPSPESTL